MRQSLRSSVAELETDATVGAGRGSILTASRDFSVLFIQEVIVSQDASKAID